MSGEALALYVHWPFCVSKCPYCDFNSHVRASIDQDQWREAEATEPDAPPAAHFACALAIAWPNDGQTETFEGRIDGTLAWPPRGDKGFGYDPMFVPVGYEQTFGELDPELKHSISHRADAFRKLLAALNE